MAAANYSDVTICCRPGDHENGNKLQSPKTRDEFTQPRFYLFDLGAHRQKFNPSCLRFETANSPSKEFQNALFVRASPSAFRRPSPSPCRSAVCAATPRWKGAIDGFRRFSAVAAAAPPFPPLSGGRALALAFVTEPPINKRCILPLLTVSLNHQ